MAEPKKAEMLAALATLDAAAESVIQAHGKSWILVAELDKARFYSPDVREAVDRVRKQRGDATDESVMHEAIRRINQTFRRSPSWQVKSWRELERLETGERVFEVDLLGVDLPEEGEMLIPTDPRQGQDEANGEETDDTYDFCVCGHTRGSHYSESIRTPSGDEELAYCECGVGGCDCKAFAKLAPGIPLVEESPPDPFRKAGGLDARSFVELLAHEAGQSQPDGAIYMALQRLLDAGWAIAPPEAGRHD